MKVLAQKISEELHILDAIISANKWEGKLGYEIAQTKLKLFFKQNRRLPMVSDKGMNQISRACLRNHWKIFGIHRWNDLLLSEFGEINDKFKKYVGWKGLDYAINKFKKIKSEKKREPKSSDLGALGFYSSASAGYWTEFGIHSWCDFQL
ncbi:MAG: hypothetical protein HeimC2_38130 [Candidatus Heimdallarchaeota archaeon LC_2]|nr:MAG: hypothetical protein HeimC2_38130 [Candidatus Heimdallarchaeota archaeon LC_2]